MNKKILIYEENWKHLEEMMMIFQMEGYEVSPFTNQEEMLNELSEKNPELLILGVKPPAESIIEFVKKAQKAGKPIILFTPDSTIDKDAIKEVGIKLFLTEPYDVEFLLDWVKSHFNFLSSEGEERK